LIDWLFDWLTDWLTDWLIDWIDRLIDWLIDWLTDWLTGCLIDWLINWLTDCLIDWLIDWLIDSLIDWLIHWLIDWSFDPLYSPGDMSTHVTFCSWPPSVLSGAHPGWDQTLTTRQIISMITHLSHSKFTPIPRNIVVENAVHQYTRIWGSTTKRKYGHRLLQVMDNPLLFFYCWTSYIACSITVKMAQAHPSSIKEWSHYSIIQFFIDFENPFIETNI